MVFKQIPYEWKMGKIVIHVSLIKTKSDHLMAQKSY